MQIEFLLLAQFDGRAVIPLEEVRKTLFPHLGMPKLVRKIDDGSIDLPILRPDRSAKATKLVLITHLADYLRRHATNCRRPSAPSTWRIRFSSIITVSAAMSTKELPTGQIPRSFVVLEDLQSRAPSVPD